MDLVLRNVEMTFRLPASAADMLRLFISHMMKSPVPETMADVLTPHSNDGADWTGRTGDGGSLRSVRPSGSLHGQCEEI